MLHVETLHVLHHMLRRYMYTLHVTCWDITCITSHVTCWDVTCIILHVTCWDVTCITLHVTCWDVTCVTLHVTCLDVTCVTLHIPLSITGGESNLQAGYIYICQPHVQEVRERPTGRSESRPRLWPIQGSVTCKTNKQTNKQKQQKTAKTNWSHSQNNPSRGKKTRFFERDLNLLAILLAISLYENSMNDKIYNFASWSSLLTHITAWTISSFGW